MIHRAVESPANLMRLKLPLVNCCLNKGPNCSGGWERIAAEDGKRIAAEDGRG